MDEFDYNGASICDYYSQNTVGEFVISHANPVWNNANTISINDNNSYFSKLPSWEEWSEFLSKVEIILGRKIDKKTVNISELIDEVERKLLLEKKFSLLSNCEDDE